VTCEIGWERVAGSEKSVELELSFCVRRDSGFYHNFVISKTPKFQILTSNAFSR